MHTPFEIRNSWWTQIIWNTLSYVGITGPDYFDFDSLIEDAEQHEDQEYDDLLRANEQHFQDISHLCFFNLVLSWFNDVSDFAFGDDKKENISLVANSYI